MYGVRGQARRLKRMKHNLQRGKRIDAKDGTAVKERKERLMKRAMGEARNLLVKKLADASW